MDAGQKTLKELAREAFSWRRRRTRNKSHLHMFNTNWQTKFVHFIGIFSLLLINFKFEPVLLRKITFFSLKIAITECEYYIVPANYM